MNIYMKQYVEENLKQQELYLTRIYRNFFKHLFKSNNILLNKTYSIKEQQDLFETNLKNFKNCMNLTIKIDSPKTGKDILNSLIKMRTTVDLAFFKEFGPDDFDFCSNCGEKIIFKNHKLPSKNLNSLSEFCCSCRRKNKQKVFLTLRYFKKKVETNYQDLITWMKEETEAGIIYHPKYMNYLNDYMDKKKEENKCK